MLLLPPTLPLRVLLWPAASAQLALTLSLPSFYLSLYSLPCQVLRPHCFFAGGLFFACGPARISFPAGNGFAQPR